MLQSRARWPQPFRDDAVIAAWNGLMIEGLVDAGLALGRPQLVQAAAHAARFVLASLRLADGSLARAWRDGAVSGAAFLEDHACLANGLLALHRAQGGSEWIGAARALLEAAAARNFTEADGWIEATADAQGRFASVGGVDDGAMPSGAGAISQALVECARLTGESRWLDLARKGLDRGSGTIAERPTSSPCSLLASQALRAIDPSWGAGARATGPVQATLHALDGSGERFELRLHIAPGHHVNAHEPGMAGLAGLSATPRDVGVRIEAEWPAAQAHASGARVLHGEVVVPIRLVAPVPAPRPLRLAVRWQCCTERECLAPVAIELEA
jgi:hypothetical protein